MKYMIPPEELDLPTNADFISGHIIEIVGPIEVEVFEVEVLTGAPHFFRVRYEGIFLPEESNSVSYLTDLIAHSIVKNSELLHRYSVPLFQYYEAGKYLAGCDYVYGVTKVVDAAFDEEVLDKWRTS